MDSIFLKEETVDRIVQYLMGRPWIEVNGLIVEIDQQVRPQKENKQKAAVESQNKETGS